MLKSRQRRSRHSGSRAKAPRSSGADCPAPVPGLKPLCRVMVLGGGAGSLACSDRTHCSGAQSWQGEGTSPPYQFTSWLPTCSCIGRAPGWLVTMSHCVIRILWWPWSSCSLSSSEGWRGRRGWRQRCDEKPQSLWLQRPGVGVPGLYLTRRYSCALAHRETELRWCLLEASDASVLGWGWAPLSLRCFLGNQRMVGGQELLC